MKFKIRSEWLVVEPQNDDEKLRLQQAFDLSVNDDHAKILPLAGLIHLGIDQVRRWKK